MKKHLLLTLTLALFFVTTFIGCSKGDGIDPGNGINPGSTLVGKWRTVKTVYYENGVLDLTETTVEENSSCPDYVEFKNNGTYVTIDNDANCYSTTVESGTYNLSGSTISITSGGSTYSATVTTLTNTDLITDFTQTSSSGNVYRSVRYFKKIN